MADDRTGVRNSSSLENGDGYNGNEKTAPESPRSVHGVKVNH
jgi:hypothetical protein